MEYSTVCIVQYLSVPLPVIACVHVWSRQSHPLASTSMQLRGDTQLLTRTQAWGAG